MRAPWSTAAVLGAALLGGRLGAEAIALDDISGPDRSIADSAYGVTAHFPLDWIIDSAQRWGDQATTIFFRSPACGNAFPALYYRVFHEPLVLLPGEIQPWLQKEAERKVGQRIAEGLADYHNVPGSFEFTASGSQSALTWTAEFTQDHLRWTECLTAVLTEKGLALFFMRIPTDKKELVAPDFQKMVATLRMP